MAVRKAECFAVFFSPGGAPSRLQNRFPSSAFQLNHLLQPFQIRAMADPMGDVITVNNFSEKIGAIDPQDGSSNHLYALVDMGR